MRAPQRRRSRLAGAALGSLVIAGGAAAAQQGAVPEAAFVRAGDRLDVGLGSAGAFARVESRGQRFTLEGGGGVVVTDVAALHTPIVGESNRATNASLEQDGDSDGWPDGAVFVDFWGSGGSAAWDATRADDGVRSVRLDGSGGEALETPALAVAAGEELLLQASRCGTPSARFVAFWFDASWQSLGALLGDAETGGDATTFVPFGRVVTAPPRAAWLIAGWQKLAAGSLWLDQLRIVTPAASVRARLDGALQGDPAGRFVRQRTALTALHLDATLEWRGRPHGVTAALDLRDTRGGDRALQVELTVPLAIPGATLQLEPRHTTTLARTNLYGEFEAAEWAAEDLPFGDGVLASYPLLAAVDARGVGAHAAAVAVGVPPGDPHPFRLRARTEPGGGVVLSWPVGLAPEPRAAPGRTRLEWWLAAADPAWPLRSGLVQMGRLEPRYAERRFGAAGTWLAFTDPATLPNVADFGFAVHEGDQAVATDDALGIASFCYVEPWDDWVDLGDFASAPTYADALARLAAQQSGVGWSSSVVSLARAVDVGGAHDAGGALLHQIFNRPWISGSGWSCLVSLNPEAGVVDDLGRGWPAPFDHFAAIVDASAATWSAQGAALDGAYLDSITTYFAHALDFRRGPWQAIRTPLTWESGTHAVALWPPAQVTAVAAAHAQRERAAGRLLMGNALDPVVRAAALNFDYLGIEANWGAGPESDATLLWRRVAAMHRPFCVLQNTDFTAFDHADMEAFLARCLFYGHFASCFSVDASSFPYFEDSSLYERDRALFVQYVPLVRELDLAGWQPMTHATSDRAHVLLERFGGGASGGALPLFTVMNDGTVGVHATVTIAKAPLALGTITSVTDAIRGRPLSFNQDATSVTIRDALAPGAVRMIRLQ